MDSNDDCLAVLNRFKDGRKLKVTIKQATPELTSTILDHMMTYFLPREPMNNYLDYPNDPESIKNLENVWRKTVEKGSSIVALLTEVDGQTMDEAQIVGANVTALENKSDHQSSFQGKGRVFKLVGKVLEEVNQAVDVFGLFSVDKYLAALGLSVSDKFHGLGLGNAILAAREPLCRRLGVGLTVTAFTSPASQHLASKQGYMTLFQKEFRDFYVDGQQVFTDLSGGIKLMAKEFK